MLRGDPPPRMAKGHVARHAVPPCAREPTLEVHHRHLLLRRKYKEKQKERGANKKKLIASRPRRRQATKIACGPDQGKKHNRTLSPTQRAPRSGQGGAYRSTHPPQS